MPAYNESLGLVGSGGKYLTEWGNKAGLDMDQQIQQLKARPPGDLGQVVLSRTPTDPARPAPHGRVIIVAARRHRRAATTRSRWRSSRNPSRESEPRRRHPPASPRPALAGPLALARNEARWGLLFISPWIIGFLVVHPRPDDRVADLQPDEPQP